MTGWLCEVCEHRQSHAQPLLGNDLLTPIQDLGRKRRSLVSVGKLLGHTQVSTTQRYAHLAEDPVRQDWGADIGGDRSGLKTEWQGLNATKRGQAANDKAQELGWIV